MESISDFKMGKVIGVLREAMKGDFWTRQISGVGEETGKKSLISFGLMALTKRFASES